jgi:hypothetical protein
MRSRGRTALGVGMAVALGCSSGFGVEGDIQTPIPVTLVGNVMFASASVGGETHAIAIDTGSPLTMIDPSVFANGQVAAGRNVLDLTVGGSITFTGLPVQGIAICGASCELMGLLGGDVLGRYAVSFDYRNRQFAFDALAGDGNTTDVPVSIEGGGRGQINGTGDVVTIGPTRIEVAVTVEGQPHAFLVDSGASFVTVRTAVFDAMVADGRAQIDTSFLTIGGAQAGHVTRMRALDVGAAEVTALPALTLGDALLDTVSAEVGHTIDGLVGGTFLRQFLVTVDYPGRRLVLDRYASEDHVHDEFERMGMLLQSDGAGGYRTGTVFPGSDAATNPGVPACFFGSVVASIDGQAVAGLAPDDADTLLRGAPGTTKGVQVTSKCDGSPIAFAFKVEELLPLP